jgi:TonB family protein
METVEKLSSVKYGGRLAGSEGFNKAAEYIAVEFKKLKLGHFGENYFQNFDIEYNNISYASYKMINKQGKVKSYKLGKDFVCRGFTGSGQVSGDVVFCGYGTSNDSSYDDFANIDVKNKIVMVFKPAPKWGEGWLYNDPREKTNYAVLKGAKAVIFVSLQNDPKPQKPIGSTISGKGEQNEKVPQLHIDIAAANELLSGTGYTLSRLQTIIDSTQKPVCINLLNKVSIDVKAKYEEEKPTMNIVGRLTGYEPEFKDEYIVIGAHLDHVGAQRDLLFPGANDNASGAAAVLEIARAMIGYKMHPKYSILFVIFSGEEHGMDGSKYFVKNSPVPLNKIKYMLNMDCIGYGDSIQIGGGKSNPEIWNKIKSIDSANAKLMVNATWPGGGADAQAFFDAGIKTAYFVSTNSYEYLHMPGDKPETLNKKLFQSIAQLAFLTLINLSEATQDKDVRTDCNLPDMMPSFPGEQENMINFINSNMVYPASAYNNNIEGKVYLQFLVDEYGILRNAELVRGIDSECNKEAICILEQMPNWEPAKFREGNFDLHVNIPIIFNKKVYDNFPKYPGGRDEMYKFINGKLELLSIDCISKKERTVYIKFSIDSLGQLCNISVLQGINKYYDDKVVRVIKMMPKWIPGKIDNRNVTRDVIIPVTFDKVSTERYNKK